MTKTISTSHLQKMLMLLALVVFAFATTTPSFATSENGGTWIKKQYKIKGAWEIVTIDGQTIIKFKDGFKTKGGPDLKVFLSKQDIASVTGKNATQDAIFISELQSKKGNQEYILPEGINISDYNSILIHCEAYSVLWGGSNI